MVQFLIVFKDICLTLLFKDHMQNKNPLCLLVSILSQMLWSSGSPHAPST